MSFAAFRRLGFAAAWSVGVTLLLAAGCSGQGEGERCSSAKNGDGDCDDGLMCIPLDQLQDGSNGDRCCAPDGAPIGDARCTRKTGAGNVTGGAGGGGGTGTAGNATSGSGGTAAGGTAAGGTAAGGTAGNGQGEAGADGETTGGSADTGTGGLTSSGAGGV